MLVDVLLSNLSIAKQSTLVDYRYIPGDKEPPDGFTIYIGRWRAVEEKSVPLPTGPGSWVLKENKTEPSVGTESGNQIYNSSDDYPTGLELLTFNRKVTSV